MQTARYFCPLLTKFGISQLIFIQVPSIKRQGKPPSGRRADTRGQTNSLTPFQSRKALLRRFNVSGNNKTYLGLHVYFPKVLPDFNQIWIF
jgi:hypothetical protein